jgi:septal ring factor EnvC (AmiA/AmiB activator)
MPNKEELYQEVIKAAHENVLELKKKTTELAKLQQKIEDEHVENNKIPNLFKEQFEKIAGISRTYTETLGEATTNYLDGNNQQFLKNRKYFTEALEALVNEIDRLMDADFEKLFQELQGTIMEEIL